MKWYFLPSFFAFFAVAVSLFFRIEEFLTAKANKDT
jgi:hypothetical protein